MLVGYQKSWNINIVRTTIIAQKNLERVNTFSLTLRQAQGMYSRFVDRFKFQTETLLAFNPTFNQAFSVPLPFLQNEKRVIM